MKKFGLNPPDGNRFAVIKKGLFVMKITLVLILTSTLNLLATGTYSQTARVSLNLNQTSVKQVLKIIEQSSEFYFLYNNELVDVERKVDIHAENEQIGSILDQIFTRQETNYAVYDRQIVISPSNMALPQPAQRRINGKVTDSSGATLPGVSIVVKGTTSGIVTDSDGKFTLMVSADTKALIFSFVGMTTQEIVIGNKSELNVALYEATIGLDEVVAIGYGTVKKSDLTGSVSSVKSETLEYLPVKSLAEALQGKVAGVYVTKGSGEPGATSDIMIRGAGSINGMGPLYVVDGVSMGTDANFNMSDVENIEILKDASSAAIYGIGAAGGVILVTTKKGKAGEKMHVNFDVYYGSRSAVNLPTLLDSKDYIKARKVMGVEYATWNNSQENTDWVKEMYKPATEQKYDLSLSGGNEKSTYFISAGYLKEEGIRRDNWFERYSLRINSDHKLSDNLIIGQVLYINKTKNRPTGGGALPYRSIPLMAVYDAKRVGGWAGVPDGFQGTNYVGDAENHIYNNNGWGMEGNFFADWKIIKGLNLRATAGGYMGGSDNSQFNLLYDYGILKNDIRKLDKNLTRDESMTGDLVLTYNRTLGKHEIKVMAGWEVKKGTSSGVDASTEGFPVYYEPSFSTSTQSSTSRYATGDYGKWSQLSQFGRLNYNYAGKYLLQGTVRRDGTNQFIGNNRYGIFPSISGAWKVSEESFLKDKIEWVSTLKVRAGWGVLGHAAGGDYVYQTAYKSSNVTSYDGINSYTGWASARFANADLRWEKVTTKNLGFDFAFLHNKLTLSVDVYDKQTTDMIYDVALPASAGIGYYNGSSYNAVVNIGKISNKGFEFVADWNDKIGDFSYSIGTNASFNKNKVLKVDDNGSIFYNGGATWLNGSTNRTESGYAMGQFYGYIADGVYKTDAQAAIGPKQAGNVSKAGDLIYRDLNGLDANGKLIGKPDGKIDDADKTQIGNPWPKCYYGINISAAYKGFDLKVFFSGQSGVDLFNATKGIKQSFYADWNTTSEIFNTSNFGNTTITNLPSVYQTSTTGEILRDPNGNYKNISSYFIENGSYLKLKDLQFGYTLPKNVSSRIGLSTTRIYIAGSNLFTITKYTGIDPELGGGVNGRGVETDGLYPQTRFISLGVNLKF